MRRVVPILFLIFLIFSCTSQRQTQALLEQADSLIQSHPDSSLVILQGIDPNGLGSQKQRAFYALLLCQALDLNGIVVKSDSIITPALDYYRSHGPTEHQLRNCYNAAVIANNAGDTDAAMEWLARGEAHIPHADDLYTSGHIYLMKSRLYKDLLDYSSALENDLKSSSFFMDNKYWLKYAISQISLADDYLHLDDLASGNKALDILVPYWDNLPATQKASYLKTRINLAASANDTLYVIALKDSCYSQISNRALRPWLAISDAYSASGMLDSALYVLGEYARYNPESLDMNYYTRLADVYEKRGEYPTSVEMHKKAAEVEEDYMKEILNSDTRFMEERYLYNLNQLRQRHQRTSLIAAIAVILLLGMIAITFFRKAWKKSESNLSSLKAQFEILQKERDTLFAAQQESELMDDDIRQIVNERLAVLDKVLLGHLTSNPVDLKAANDSIEELFRDRDEFIVSTAKVFASSHPKFVSFLKEHNLSQWEIGYCCLFLMGMYSKDLEPHFSRATSNKFNSTIRNKLGLPLNGPKLKTYLLETCKRLEA